jgi:hypothetical protein
MREGGLYLVLVGAEDVDLTVGEDGHQLLEELQLELDQLGQPHLLERGQRRRERRGSEMTVLDTKGVLLV